MYILKFVYHNLTLYLPLVIILVLGIIVAFEDWQEGKIKNKWLKLGFGLGLIYYLIQIVLSVLGFYAHLDFEYFLLNYYLMILMNTALSFLIVFVMWYFKLWAGGDAKYFILLVFLMPLYYYSQAYLPYWPAMNLLINISLPIFIYLLVKMLIYPLQLGYNYLKNPVLLKKYINDQKNKHKIDKKKVVEYLLSALSFIVILVVFQIIRTRLVVFLSPYLGSFVTASYFVLGLYVFKPLRSLLKRQTILVIILLAFYFIFGYVFFREIVFADLHKIFALQMIFMLLYFYIFKYGQLAWGFLYNSAEVKYIPVADLTSGVYVSKSYINQIMGTRNYFEDFIKELTGILTKEELDRLSLIIELAKGKLKKNNERFELIMAVQNFRLDSLFQYGQKYFQDRRKNKVDNIFLDQVRAKLTLSQKNTLDDILRGSNDVKRFLRTLSGRLTGEQAEKLKIMINKRNEEVVRQGLEPINNIILHKTFSFAPFMLLGVIVTVITKSSLIHLVYQYFFYR